MINLTIDEIIYLHEKLIQKTGGMLGIAFYQQGLRGI